MHDVLDTDQRFLSGGWDMGLRMRAHDWSTSPLGMPQNWPQSLKSVVSLMLNSRYPMFVAWGPELAFLYNDSYAPIFGAKHPNMLGRPFREAWSEIWDDIHPLITRALAGEATYDENMHLVMERNGYREDTYYSFSYSPVLDETGTVGGIFCVCTETTQQVLAERAAAAERDRQREMLLQMPGFVATMSGPDLVYTYVNDAYLAITERDDFIGRPFRDIFPDVAGQGFQELFESVFHTGKGVVTRGMEMRLHGRQELQYVDFALEPIRDDKGVVTGVFVGGYETTDLHLGNVALRESEARLRALTDHLPGGMVYQVATDADGQGRRFLFMSQRHEEFTGVPAEAVMNDASVGYSLIHEDDRELLAQAELDAIAGDGSLDVEVRYRHVSGNVRWCRIISNRRVQADGSMIWDGMQIDITEQKRALDALRESELRFKQIADSAPVPIWVTRLDRTRSFVNKAYLDFLGVDYQTALTFDWRSILHPDDHDRIIAESIAGEASLESFTLEARYRAGDGEWHWIRSQSQPRWGPDGAHIGFIGVAHDITEAKWAEIALRESENRFRFLDRLAEATQTGDEPEAVMRAATRLLGEHLGVDICAYADVEADGDSFHIRQDWTTNGIPSIAGTYSLDDFGPAAAAAQRSGSALIVRDAVAELGQDQAFTSIGIAATICLPLVKQGRLAAMMAVHNAAPRDWTTEEVSLVREVAERCWAHVERVGANAILRTSEQRFREQFENANDFIFTTDLEMRITSCNPAVAAALERCPDELIGRPISDFIPPETWERNKEMLAAKLIGKGDATRYEAEVFDHRGERMMWEINSRLVRDANGTPIGLHAIGRDVSEQIRNQQLLVEARQRAETDAAEQAAILGQLAEGVILTDADGKITFVNEAATKLHGVAALDVEPAQYAQSYNLFREDGSPYPFEELPLARAVMRGETVRNARWRIRRPDGSEVLVIGNAQPVLGPDGTNIGAVLTIRDDTARNAAERALLELNETLEERVAKRTAELEQAQEALRQSQKLEAMGQLTGGVAHDFNNLLTPILGSLDLLHRRGIGDERERKLIDGALQSAERAKLLVQRLLAFARRQPLKSVAVDVGQLIGGMAELVGSTCGPNVRVSVAIDSTLPAALADPNQLEMAILNLSVNARDAMPDGGRLTLSATSETIEACNLRLDPGQYIRISVADTGTGMDQSTIQRAIEPFFSTKGIGRGTGLGLSMVHGLASQLGGALTISSTPGLGTNVELWLPASTMAVEAMGETQPDTVAQVNAGTILLVDDELLVRTSTADMLTELGYEVVEASSAEAAITIFVTGRFDLLVTDHLMPGMSGVDLVNVLREQQPGLPVLIVSGYADIDGIPPSLPRLTKPFRHADLAAAIAATVEPKPGFG